MMEVSLENYELQYDLFLAESELFDNLILYGSNYVNESVGLITIHEGVKDTILNYLQRITEAIQKAWERFKEICLKKVDEVYLKSISDKMKDPKPEFTINNYPDYDINKLSTIKLTPFDYESMKDSLGSKEVFINKYYSNIPKDEKSIADNIEKMVIRSRKDTPCTGDILKSMYEFVTSGFKSELSKIEADLKVVNTSNKNIQNMVSKVSATETTNEAVCLYESYITEEKEDDTKVGFEDNKDASKSNNKNIVSEVTTYVKASTDILTAKMKVLKNIYGLYMRTIRHYAPPFKKKDKEESSENKQTGSLQIKV